MSRRLDVQFLPVLLVEPNPARRPRRYSACLLEGLAAQIKKHGVQAITVREEEDRWFVVTGEQTRQACLAAGLEAIPCIVVSPRSKP